MALSSCSSTNTETNNAAATTETTQEASGARMGNTKTGPVTDTTATTGTAMANQDTTSFAMVAASSDMFEKLSSEQAQSRATHPEVKKFAQMMLTDHNKTTQELKSIASSKNIILPVGPLPMHQRLLLRVTREDQKEFDEEYMETQVMAHRMAVELFETASKSERDAELRAFASRHLPSLRTHLEMAKKTKDLVD